MLYQEQNPITKKTSALVVPISFMLMIVGFFLSVYLMILGFFAFLISITVWSIYKYSGVSLDSNTLSVGSDKVLLQNIDKDFGVRHGEDVLSPRELGSLELGLRSFRKKSNIKILGGAYGRQKVEGRQWLALKMNDNSTRYVLQPKDRIDLKNKLDKLLSQATN